MSSENGAETNIFEGIATAVEARDLLFIKWQEAANKHLQGLPEELRGANQDLARTYFDIGNILFGIGQEKATLASLGYSRIETARESLGLWEEAREDIVIEAAKEAELLRLLKKRDQLADTVYSGQYGEYESACDQYGGDVGDIFQRYLGFLIRRNSDKVAHLLCFAVFDTFALGSSDKESFPPDGLEDILSKERNLGNLLKETSD